MFTKLNLNQIARAAFILFIAAGMISLIACSYFLFQSLHQLEDNTAHGYESQILAEELQESSDELTRLARTFAATANPRFEIQFHEVIKIRNGQKPRPQKNNALYWNLAATQDRLPIIVGEKKSLMDRFKSLGLKKNELALLLKSNQLSDKLTKLEEIAFRAVKNTPSKQDEIYRLKGESNKEMALRILNDDRYHALKINIMIPIQEFITLLWNRVDKKKIELTNRIQHLKMTIGFLIIFVFGVLHSYMSRQKTNNKHISSEIEKTQKENVELIRISETDPLTQISNRRSLDYNLHAEWQKCESTGTPLSVILIDIDHFKDYNDMAGHQAGDLCLKQVAALLASSINRAGEFVARYGGEEFIIVLPNTSIEFAETFAERTRVLIMSAKLHSKNTNNVTISAGVACQIPNKKSSPEELIEKADKALYKAKENGRNRIEISKPKSSADRILNLV